MTEIMAAHAWRHNGWLIADVSNLGYLTESDLTLDATFGRGVWWKQWAPQHLIAAGYTGDSKRATPSLTADFTALPFRDNTFDTVAYDPPYQCADEETEILTSRGFLRWDEVQVGDEAWTLSHGPYPRAEWNRITAVHRYQAVDLEMVEMKGKSHSSLTTLNHRWPIIKGKQAAWTTSTGFKAGDTVPISAPHAGPSMKTYSDAFVELVAWFWTEGTLDGNYGNICQSHEVNAHKCALIRAAFTAEFGPDHGPFPRLGRKTDGVPRWREVVDGHKLVWWFSSDVGRQFQAVAPNMVPSMGFLRKLTSDQLALFVERSIDGDGCRSGGKIVLGQKRWDMANAFQIAAILAGHSTAIHTNKRGNVVTLRHQTVFKPSRNHPCRVNYTGVVWCVGTANQTWLARRNGTTYFTGNSKGTPHKLASMDEHYGVGNNSASDTLELMRAGLTECARVTVCGGTILTKAGRGIVGGKLWRGDDLLVTHGEALGLEVVAQFRHLTTPRSQAHRGPQKSPRSNYSTLTIWRKPK